MSYDVSLKYPFDFLNHHDVLFQNVQFSMIDFQFQLLIEPIEEKTIYIHV